MERQRGPKSEPSRGSRRCSRGSERVQIRGLVSLSALTISLLCLVGCVTPIDGGRGFPPFYETTPPSPAVVDRSAVETANAAAVGSEIHLWPLLSRTVTPKRTETRVLFPLFKDEITANERRSWALPIFHRSRYTHTDGTTDTQTLLLPTLYGNDAILGRYFSIFPLGGTAKGILGHDRIDYALFPLYTRARDRDRVSHHVLFPLINWTSGSRVRGGRFFPLFSRYQGFTPEGEHRYTRSSYLWPLIHIHDSNLHRDHPTTVRWFWPFYGRVKSDRLERWSFAWPLLGKDVYTKRELSSVYLFPLLRFSWLRDDLVQYDIYPLFGHKSIGGTTRNFVLWPLVGWESQQEANYARRSQWFFPFYRRTVTEKRRQSEGAEEGEGASAIERTALTRVWPLYRYRSHADGRQEWNLLDPLPFMDAPGFDAFYSRIWRIYREVDVPAEERRAWELLWGIAGGSRTPETTRFSILGGLFGREERKGADGTSSDTTWRLLYIPF